MDQFDSYLSQLQKLSSSKQRNKKNLDESVAIIDRLKEISAQHGLANPDLGIGLGSSHAGMNLDSSHCGPNTGGGSSGTGSNLDPQYLLKLRTFLELSAFVFLEMNDTENFKLVYAQLRPLYFDLGRMIEKSQNMTTIISMWMLHLLSENKIGDLYMLLERIPPALKRDDKIAFVIKLEGLMMEGNLGQLLELDLARSNTGGLEKYGAEYYKIIASTARNKIASSIELCYKQLSLAYLSRLLKLKSQHEMLDFISYYNQFKLQQVLPGTPYQDPYGPATTAIKQYLDPEASPWKIVDNYVVFQNEVGTKHRIPSKELLANSLEYLNDLEKII